MPAAGSLHLCFVADNPTRGGNSGSTVFDASDNLVGVNFDCYWERTMRNLMFDTAVFCNISLEIRYFIFIFVKIEVPDICSTK